jgi:hypothetical protein
MITFIIGAIVGLIAGWYIPQPEFLKNLLKKKE